jgi:hypothetical protein
MPSNGSSLLVPLRSNASALLTGTPIASVRRRLKFASLYFDHVFLEEGVFRMSAGPNGSFGAVSPIRDGEIVRWQTPVRRGAEQAVPFTIGIGQEAVPGVPPPTMHTAIASKTAISWTATLEPFADELPAGTDWISFTQTHDPSGKMSRVTDQWRWADERNEALASAIPERFVRGSVIQHANRDLGFGTQYGAAISVDSLHVQVIAQRFKDDDSWKLCGFAVPILFPQVADMTWEAIAGLRRHQEMIRLRGILREIEHEASAETANGDIEAAAHHAYERHLAAASGTVDSLGTVIAKTGGSVLLGGAIGAAMLPLPPLLGFAVGTVASGGVTAIGNVRGMISDRRAKGWVSLAQRIAQPDS